MKRCLPALAGVFLGTLLTWSVVPALGEVLHSLVPASRWLEVKSVRVGNVRVGESPQVQVERLIHRSVNAGWTVTLHKVMPEGLEHVCARSGNTDFHVSSITPKTTKLNWWMNVPVNPPCNPEAPGTYVVTMVWTLQANGFPPKIARRMSNKFEVTE